MFVVSPWCSSCSKNNWTQSAQRTTKYTTLQQGRDEQKV